MQTNIRYDRQRSVLCSTLLGGVMAIVCLLAFAPEGHAGKLDNFERDATRHSRVYKSAPASSDSSGCHNIFECAIQVLIDSIDFSMHIDASITPEEALPISDYQPVAEFGFNYLDSGSNLYAFDIRSATHGELFGLNVRYTQFRERNPVDVLEIAQLNGEYLPNLGAGVRLGIGMGLYQLSGNGSNLGLSFSIPLRIYAMEHLRFEFNPVFAIINDNPIDDYDLSVSFAFRKAALSAGYRLIKAPTQSLSGPYIGYSLYW